MSKQNFLLTTKEGEWYNLDDSEYFRLIEMPTMEQELPHTSSSNLISVSINAGLIVIADNQILPQENRHSNMMSRGNNSYHLKIYSGMGVEFFTNTRSKGVKLCNNVHYISWNNSSDHLFVFSDNTTISIYDYRCREVQSAFHIHGHTYAHTPTRNGILFLCRKSDKEITLCLLHYSNAYRTYKLSEIAISEFTFTGHTSNTFTTESEKTNMNTRESKSTATEATIAPSRCSILTLSNNDTSSANSDTTKCLVLLRCKSNLKEELLQQPQQQQQQHMLQCVFHPERNEIKELKINLESLSIVKWSLSPNEKYFVLLTEEGVLYVASSSFDMLTQISSNALDTDTILQLDWLSNTSLCYLQQQANFIDDALVHTCELHFWHVNAFASESSKQVLSVGTTTFGSSSSSSNFMTNSKNNNHPIDYDYGDDDDDTEKNDEEVIDGLSADTYCVREIDGLRLISGKKQFLLQHAPECVKRVFSLGSQYSSAKLVTAFDKFMSGDPTAVALINNLKSNKTELARAIDDCVETAKWEFDVEQQKRLLRIAALGKSLYELYDATSFISTIQTIRLRHTLHMSPLKIVISDKQLSSLGADRLIRRLVLLEQFNYAITTSQVFGMEESDILHGWAVMQFTKCDSGNDNHKDDNINVHSHVNRQKSEQDIAKKVIDKLTSYTHFSFTKLALTLHSHGKRHAALMMLKNEKIPSRQVSTLLSINEPEVALEKAVESHHADLIFTVVQFLVETRKANAMDLIMSISDAKAVLEQISRFSPAHKNLLYEYIEGKLSYAAIHDNLLDYFDHELELKHETEHGHDANNGEWWERLQQSKIDALENVLAQLNAEGINVHARKTNTSTTATATSTLASAKATKRGTETVPSNQMTNPHTDRLVSAEHKLQMSNLSTSNAIDANMKWQAHEVISAVHLAESVVHEQNACMKECSNDDRFISASVSEMIQYAFEHRKTKLAERLSKKYNVPDAMFMWAMLRGYASTNDWEAIDSAMLTRIQVNDAFDTEPVVSTLLLYNRTNQAKQFIPRVANINRRMEYYVTCEDWRRAAEDCKEQRDVELLCQLRERARGNTDALREINSGWDGALETARIDLKRLFS